MCYEMWVKWCVNSLTLQEVEMIENVQALLQQRILESDSQLRFVFYNILIFHMLSYIWYDTFYYKEIIFI